MAQRDYVEKDYYALLGVGKDAEQAEISKAYRRLARENHPDTKPGDAAAEARFKEISEAYSVLSSAEKRAEYDQVRSLVGSGGGGFGGFGGAGGEDISDLLGQVFGGAGRRRGPTPRGPLPGRDLETSLTLSFADAMAGVTTTLRVNGPAPCSTCRGSGAAPGTSPVTCQVCAGRGVVASNQGLFSFSEPCTACRGTGRQIPTPCPTCRGSGTEVRHREIRARIPAGVRDGARIRLAGKGEAGAVGGRSGDLYVQATVEAHPLFTRRGDDLLLALPVTFAEASLGTQVAVPTLDEPVRLKIPEGTPNGKTLRVRGRGAPRPGGGTGDLLVTVEVAVPRRLTATQRKALETFAQLDEGEVRAGFAPYLAAPAAAAEA